HWLKRWSLFRQSSKDRRRRSVRPFCQRLEARETPAFFTGGIHVALGSVGVVAGVGPGGVPMVAVHDPVSGALKSAFLATDPLYTGGVNVAASSDGSIVTAGGSFSVPMVNVFDIAGTLKGSFLAF